MFPHSPPLPPLADAYPGDLVATDDYHFYPVRARDPDGTIYFGRACVAKPDGTLIFGDNPNQRTARLATHRETLMYWESRVFSDAHVYSYTASLAKS